MLEGYKPQDFSFLTAVRLSTTSRSRALRAQTLAHRASNTRPERQPRPRRLDNRNIIALNNHEQPQRGVRLFASTEQPVYRLEPSPEEREPRERWSPSLTVKKGTGDDCRKTAILLRRQSRATPLGARACLRGQNSRFTG